MNEIGDNKEWWEGAFGLELPIQELELKNFTIISRWGYRGSYWDAGQK